MRKELQKMLMEETNKENENEKKKKAAQAANAQSNSSAAGTKDDDASSFSSLVRLKLFSFFAFLHSVHFEEWTCLRT